MINRWQKLQFFRSQQQAFLEDLAVLVEDGVPVRKAVETIAQITDGPRRYVAQYIERQIAEGKQLADGMIGWFSRPIVEVIRAGELGGTLPAALRAAAGSYSEQTNAIRTLIHFLAYPLVIICLALFVVVFVKNSVLDDFAHIRAIQTWPEVGRELYMLGVIIERAWWIILLAVALLIYILSRMFVYLTGAVRSYVDIIPGLSLYRKLTAARFMETLGMLLANGVAIKHALSVMHRDAAPYLSWHLLKMEYRLTGGSVNIADVLDTELLDKNDIVRLKVVSQGRGFEHALMSLGKQAAKRSNRELMLTGKIIGGIFMGLGALIAATMIFGIYLVGSSIA